MKSSFNLRKLTAIALAGIMMCSTLTGCANSGLNDMADSINKKYGTSEPAEKVTVTFDADGGTCNTTTLSIDKGQKITNIPSATKSNHDFLGWYDTNNNQLTTDTAINENITYTAKWKSKTTPVTKSTVKFDANGGMCDTTQIEVVDGQTISNIPEPFMNGYTFEGWFDDNGNKLTTNTVISYDIMYTAKWTKDKEPEVQKWSVIFNPNEGTFDNNPALQLITITVDNGKSIDTSNIPVVKRDGYDFAGWYTQANGGVLFEQSIKISSNRTLYAHWNKQMVKVTYNANGGTFSDGTSSKTSDIEKNATISNPPTPTRSNHTFNGWYTDQACTKAFNSSSKIASNITLYAKWTADKPVSVTHKVTLNLQGGYFTNSNSTYYINVKDNNVIGQLPSVWKTDYEFTGWNTKSDGTGTAIAEDTIISSLTKSDITIYAQWQKEKDYYTVTFNAAGGNCSTKSVNVKKNNMIGLTNIPEATKTGVTFAGWFDSDNNKLEEKTIISKDITYTAKYVDTTGSNYAVTFISKYDQGPITYTVTKNSKIGKVPSNPTRKGYNFQGWYTSYVENSATRVTANTVVNSDMTVYAKWTPKTYQITYNLPEGVSWSYADNNDNMFMNVQLQNDTPYYIMDDVPVRESQKDESKNTITTYEFKGWSVGTSNDNLYQPDDYFVPNKYTVLNPQFEPHTNTIKPVEPEHPDNGSDNNNGDNNNGDDDNNNKTYTSSKLSTPVAAMLQTSATKSVKTTSDSDIDIQYNNSNDDISITNIQPSQNTTSNNDIVIEQQTPKSSSNNDIQIEQYGLIDDLVDIIQRFTVKFNANGGAVKGNTSVTKRAGNTIHSLPAAFKNGWISTGWWNGTEHYTEKTPINESVTLTANYSRQIKESDYKNIINANYVRKMYKDYLLKYNIDSANSDSEVINFFYKNMMFKGFRPASDFDPDYYYDYVRMRYGTTLNTYKDVYNFYIGWGLNNDPTYSYCKHQNGTKYDDSYVAINIDRQEDIFTWGKEQHKVLCACGEIFDTIDDWTWHALEANDNKDHGESPITIKEKIFAKKEDHAHTDRNLIIYCGNSANQVTSKLISRVYDPY